MKTKIKYFISMILMVGAITACSDESLEETNPNSVSADIYWSNLEESNSNLTSVYGAMYNHFIWGFDIEAWRSDLGFPKSRTNSYQKGLPWYEKRFSNSIIDVSRKWEALYQVIFRANQVIQGLEGMDAEFKSDERWTIQMAEARFFRGLAHFYLHSTYNNGKIILRDKIPADPSEFSTGLTDADVVQDFFRADLEYAYQNLPAQQVQKTRANAGLAALLLGKTYLYTEEYTKAMVYLNDVINNSEYGYRLLEGDEVNLLFTSAGDFNAESIFEINNSDQHQLEDSTWDEESFFTRWPRFSAPAGQPIQGVAYFVPSSWLTHAYSKEVLDSNDTRNYVDDGSGGTKLRNVPLRAAQMIAVVNDETSEYYQAPAANSLIGFGGTIFSFFKKFTNHDIVSSEANIAQTPWKSGKNVVVYRLADAYLMYAECLIETGDLAGAIEHINKIRQRWGVESIGVSDGSNHDFDGVVYTQETLREHLRHVEKPLELSLEGHFERTIDLRRWGVAKQRFQDLAAMDFYLDNYTPTGVDVPNRNKSLITEGMSPTAPTDPTVQLKEFETAASEYNTALHDYLPLPLTEVLYNQEVNN